MSVGSQWRTHRGDEFQRFVPIKVPSSATTVTASAAAAAGSSATVSLAPAQAASTSAATTSGEIAAGDAMVAVMDGTGLRRSQRKAPVSNGDAAGLLTMAGTSTKDELRRNDSGGAVSDVLAAILPKRMSILNKQLNYADGDESEGSSGIVPTGRPSQIGVGQQFQAELPEHGDQHQQKHQQQQQRAQAVQTTTNASSSSKEDLVDRDECLWSSTEFANTKLMELKDLEVFCDVVRRHSNLDIEKALLLLNSSSFSHPLALCNLEKFTCNNAEKSTKWLESMDEQFIDLLNKHGKNFGKIAKNLSGEWNRPQAELVQRYYALKSQRCFSSNSAQFVRCPHIKILGPPVEASDRRPVARTKCANCTQKLWRDPAKVGAEWRGRRRPPVLCPPCELYARKQKMHRPAQLLLEDDPNYDVKAQKPAPPDERHDDGNVVSGGAVAEDAPRQQRQQRHNDCKCMLARAVATRVKQQQLAQLQRRRLLDIKQEVPTTPEGTTNGVAEAEAYLQNDDNNNSDWHEEMKQRCVRAFLTVGKNFEAIAASLGGTKSADDIADFYSEHQFTLRLDYIISLHERAKHAERNVPTLRATARNGQQKQQQKAKTLAGKTNKKVPPVKKVIVKQEIVSKRGECVRKAETGRNSVEREETEQKQQHQQTNGAGGEEEMTAFDELLAEVHRIRRRNEKAALTKN
uniref:ELM2 domain-containing protein n=1 Tax=Globodera rostochiensis TaxID=31243 RepID=A0A914HAL1_GLORO